MKIICQAITRILNLVNTFTVEQKKLRLLTSSFAKIILWNQILSSHRYFYFFYYYFCVCICWHLVLHTELHMESDLIIAMIYLYLYLHFYLHMYFYFVFYLYFVLTSSFAWRITQNQILSYKLSANSFRLHVRFVGKAKVVLIALKLSPNKGNLCSFLDFKVKATHATCRCIHNMLTIYFVSVSTQETQTMSKWCSW